MRRSSTKYHHLRDWLLKTVSNDKVAVDKLPAERKIAEARGVSRVMVRRAVKSLVEEGVLESRPGIGTFVNRDFVNTYNSRRNGDTLIGIAMHEGKLRTRSLSPYVWNVLQSIIRRLTSQGVRCELLSLEYSGPTAASELVGKGVQGVVWIAPVDDALETVDCLREKGVPSLFVGGSFIKSPFPVQRVCCDDFQGAVMATEHLLDAGHRRVLFVSNAPSRHVVRPRWEGFELALARYGLEPDTELTLTTPRFDVLEREVCEKARRDLFSGVFVADGIYLPSTYFALRMAGRSIPGETSLITFDQPIPGTCPGLDDITSVTQPLRELGETAAKRILAILRGDHRRDDIILKPKLNRGTTCARTN